MAGESGVRIEFGGAPEQLQKLAVFMTDLRTFWPRIVPLVTGWWREQFDTQGGFAGKEWAPLSPDYAARKAVMFPGKPILQATGALKQAASRPSRVQTPVSLTLTIDDPKLEYLQDGTDRMPARPLVFGEPLPAAAAAELQVAADEYVSDLLGRI